MRPSVLAILILAIFWASILTWLWNYNGCSIATPC